jgi:hypothetical protein
LLRIFQLNSHVAKRGKCLENLRMDKWRREHQLITTTSLSLWLVHAQDLLGCFQ